MVKWKLQSLLETKPGIDPQPLRLCLVGHGALLPCWRDKYTHTLQIKQLIPEKRRYLSIDVHDTLPSQTLIFEGKPTQIVSTRYKYETSVLKVLKLRLLVWRDIRLNSGANTSRYFKWTTSPRYVGICQPRHTAEHPKKPGILYVFGQPWSNNDKHKKRMREAGDEKSILLPAVLRVPVCFWMQ